MKLITFDERDLKDGDRFDCRPPGIGCINKTRVLIYRCNARRVPAYCDFSFLMPIGLVALIYSAGISIIYGKIRDGFMDFDERASDKYYIYTCMYTYARVTYEHVSSGIAAVGMTEKNSFPTIICR